MAVWTLFRLSEGGNALGFLATERKIEGGRGRRGGEVRGHDGVWVCRLPSRSYVHDGAYDLDSYKSSKRRCEFE